MIRARAKWRIRSDGKGGFDLRLPADERELLRDLPARLASALDELGAEDEIPEPLRRLFPIAHPRNPNAQANFDSVSRAELLEHHRDALACLERTADASHVSAEEMEGWLAGLNDLRLVLGSSLGVTEEMDEPDPNGPRYADWLCYHYLSYLAGEVVEVLTGVLPPPDPTADGLVPDDPWGEPLGGLRWDGTPVPGEP